MMEFLTNPFGARLMYPSRFQGSRSHGAEGLCASDPLLTRPSHTFNFGENDSTVALLSSACGKVDADHLKIAP